MVTVFNYLAPPLFAWALHVARKGKKNLNFNMVADP